MNVLLIVVDDLRPQLNCYGCRQMVTPNIDRLAAGGTLFERAFCQQPLCAPSRASTLSGCRPDTTKIYDFRPLQSTLPGVLTLPMHFKNHGYAVHGVGKIFHFRSQDDPDGWSEPIRKIERPSYQQPENLALIQAATRDVTDPAALKRKQRYAARPVEAASVPDDAYADGAGASAAIERLERLAGQTFFLGVGFSKPHVPYIAPGKYWDLYRREDMELPDNIFPPEGAPEFAISGWGELRAYHGMPDEGPLSAEQAREILHGYYACVSYTDAQIGRVVGALERLGLRDNTVVVFWCDHGINLGEHGMWSNKNCAFDTAARVPLILRDPGHPSAGQRTAALVENVDIYPTLCELCALPKPDHIEGASLVPLLEAPNRPWKKAAFTQVPRQGGTLMGYSLRTDRYRFTRWQRPENPDEAVAVELYDHEQDPGENVNVAGQPENGAVVEELTAMLRAGWRGALPPGA